MRYLIKRVLPSTDRSITWVNAFEKGYNQALRDICKMVDDESYEIVSGKDLRNSLTWWESEQELKEKKK